MLETYKEYRPQMKSAGLLEWRSGTLIGSLIRARTKKDVNHSCILLRLDFEGVKDRRFTLEALGGDFKMCLLSHRLGSFNGTVYWHQLKDEYRWAADEVVSWALLQVGAPYDYKSLFQSLLGHVSSDAKLLFCSESCFYAYKAAGLIQGHSKIPWPGEFEQFELHEPRVRIF